MLLRNTFFYTAGLGFLTLAKAKNVLQGYSSPKPIDNSETARCIQYDVDVVDEWLKHLRAYAGESYSLAGKNVLELGPGSDLGIGLYLLAKGCAQYNACDVNNLVKSAPDQFYDELFVELQRLDSNVDIDFLREQLNLAKAGEPSKLNYVVRDDFDIAAAFGESTIDLVFSQAAFEHFDNIEETAARMSSACKPGALLIAQIDLQTHSRWIRVKDPNNIYRYPNWVYNIFRFRGIPNRLRPFQYQQAFEAQGWGDISITPLTQLDGGQRCYSGMTRPFSEEQSQMEYLSVMFCAKKL